MIAMKSRLVVLLFCASLIPAMQARATILPESCGSDDIKFQVTVITQLLPDWASPPIPPPTAGKAQIVFIETLNPTGWRATVPTTRFGVDGAWVGANKGYTHFAIDVTPGEHNVCVNWQSESSDEANRVSMDTFTAEAGKIYYYEIKIVWGGELDRFFNLSQLSGIEGRYRTRASGVSTWKTKKED
jgi:hypothetical protein